jgi:hypothetical protein
MGRVVFILLFLTGTLVSSAQEREILETPVLWTKYNLTWKIDEKWSITSAGDQRQFISPHRQHMFLGELNAKRKFGNGWTFGMHFSYVRFTLPHNPEVTETITRWELRPQQSLTYSRALGEKWKFAWRAELEQRFFEAFDGDGILQDGKYEFVSFRLRNQLQLTYQIGPRLSLIGFNEYHVHAGNDLPSFFDQNRVGASLKYNLTKNLAFETGYLNWYQRQRPENAYFLRHSYRVVLLITIF